MTSVISHRLYFKYCVLRDSYSAALLWWSETEPAISLSYACIQFYNKLRKGELCLFNSQSPSYAFDLGGMYS